MNQKAEKTRYSDEELYEFRVLIEKKLERAKEQLQFYLDQLSELADNPDAKVKGLDDGIGTVESERLTSMAGRQRRHIQHLENALIRIKNKAYGVCRVTGKLIAKERLKAVPHATLSIEAKQNRPRRN
ncbi:MAG: TraR/DksA C4-type zinc finger protein [Lewinellaceae bacterium]|nr:TraR/DksA C4-type zinc finger protein [Phaeodactylibacter sp.]MCB9348460.1 TraR/DksA C4-type zinc finger protein [Lewinellaceae bacterium]